MNKENLPETYLCQYNYPSCRQPAYLYDSFCEKHTHQHITEHMKPEKKEVLKVSDWSQKYKLLGGLVVVAELGWIIYLLS